MPLECILFDIDGTLTPSRRNIDPEILDMLVRLKSKVTVGVVGGSDLVKQKEQLGKDVLDLVDYSFSENGLVAYEKGQLIHCRSITDELGEVNIKKLVNWALRYVADLDIPVKRGTFVEYRTGMMNFSPIGRNCNQQERDAFNIYNLEHHIVPTMLKAMKDAFPDIPLTYAIGGQISFDVFPTGWDKTYCLRHVRDKGFKEIHFFGDRTMPGGNDHEIFAAEETIGHTVANPNDTLHQVTDLWLK